MENDTEVITQETDTETTENIEQVVEAEDVDDLKKKLATAEAQKEHWRKKATEKKPEVEQERVSSNSLNAGDMMAIKNADLDPQDMDLVEKFAKDNNISLREALSHPHAKAILAYEAELRTTAVASNVEGVRRGTVKVTDDTLLNNASANKLPTTEDDIERLISAKMKQK